MTVRVCEFSNVPVYFALAITWDDEVNTWEELGNLIERLKLVELGLYLNQVGQPEGINVIPRFPAPVGGGSDRGWDFTAGLPTVPPETVVQAWQAYGDPFNIT